MLGLFTTPLFSHNTFAGPAKENPNNFKLILIYTIMSLTIFSATSSDPNVLDSTVF